jgi:hypothetical protein
MIYDALGEKEPALAALLQAFEDRAVEIFTSPLPVVQGYCV